MKPEYFRILMSLPAFIFLTSCEKADNQRKYTEVTVESAQPAPVMPPQASDPHAGLNISPEMMKNMGADPHAGFSKEQLEEMLKQQMPQNNSSQSAMTWNVPASWQEKPASGMRLASFVNKNDPSAVDCSIVTLGNGAGGLAPNVVRWLGQLKITPPSDAEIQKFIDQQDKIDLGGGLTAIMMNFTEMQSKMPDSAPSMLAAIIDTPAQRIFVKMTGNKQKIVAESKNFRALVQSLKFK